MEDRERLMEQQQKQIDALKKQNEPADPRLKAPSASAQVSNSYAKYTNKENNLLESKR